MNKRVVVLGMGGTISSELKSKGFSPGKSPSDLLSFLPEINDLYDIETREIMQLDSANIQPSDWQILSNAIYEEINRTDVDGVIVTHGTDTMTYSATASSLMVQRHGKPVVFTGAQIPMNIVGSDGRKNLIDSIRVAAEANIAENIIVFNSRILRSVRSIKLREYDLNAFESVDPMFIGDIALNIHIDDPTVLPRSQSKAKLNTDLNPNVAMLKVFPGMNPKLLYNILDLGYDGLVLDSFGAGNIPIKNRSLIDPIKELVDNNIPVVITSQCVFGTTELLYETGTLAHEAGAIQGYDMLAEVALVKLMWALGQKPKNISELETILHRNYVGEIHPLIQKRNPY